MVIVKLPSQWQPSKVLAVVMLTSCWRKPMSIWPNALVNAQKKKWVLLFRQQGPSPCLHINFSRHFLTTTLFHIFVSSTRLTKSSPSSQIHASTKSQIGSWTDKRTSLMANTSNWPHPIWTRNCVKIWSVWRKSVPIVVCVITGVFVYVVNTQKRLAAVDVPLVYRRRSKHKCKTTNHQSSAAFILVLALLLQAQKYAILFYILCCFDIQTIKHANTINNNNTNTRWITRRFIKIPLKFVLRFISSFV